MLFFPGASTNIFWQFGVVKYLQHHRVISSKTTCYAASAGAITSALYLCNVEIDMAYRHAMHLYRVYNLSKRTFGVVGIWGYIVRLWLDDILPNDCAETLSGRLHIFMSKVSSPMKPFIESTFRSKHDVISCIMASCHIPFVLDLAPFASYRNNWFVDGQMLTRKENLIFKIPSPTEYLITFDYSDHDDYIGFIKNIGFIKIIEEETIDKMIHFGYIYAMQYKVHYLSKMI